MGQGLQRLYSQQHYDGGWGWWAEGESNPYLSAYVVFGLAKAREAGFAVPAGLLQRGLSYLESTLVSARNLQSYREANRQAFVLYVMAEAGETGQRYGAQGMGPSIYLRDPDGNTVELKGVG